MKRRPIVTISGQHTKMRPERPWWVKQRKFVIPVRLRDRIENLPEEIQKHYCFIVSKVIVETKKRPQDFANISSKYFHDCIDSNYKDFIRRLEDWEMIQVNDQYLNDPESGFTMSYRLHPNVQRDVLVRIEFGKKKVQPLRDSSELTDDVAEFVHRNLRRLTIRPELVEQPNLIDEVDVQDWAVKIHFGQFNLKYSAKVRRMYHSIVQMPSVGRKNLMLKDNPAEPLYEYDVKTCHPVLLLTLVNDPVERERYTTLLKADIYKTIATEVGVAVDDRESLKEDFLCFMNGAEHNYYYRYFLEHLPALTGRMMAMPKKEMARSLQRREAEIMTKEVPWLLMKHSAASTSFNKSSRNKTGGLNRIAASAGSTNNSTYFSIPSPLTSRGKSPNTFYIPMHDGWLGIERDEMEIAAAVRECFYNTTGYEITITKTVLQTGVETVLLPRAFPTVELEDGEGGVHTTQ